MNTRRRRSAHPLSSILHPRCLQLIAIATLLMIPIVLQAARTSVADLAQGNTAFAIDLYRRESAKPGNLFFSPYSISTALAMTYAGARDTTAQEMARTLHFPGAADQLAPAFSDLAGRMDRIQKGGLVKLGIANSLWCRNNYKFLPAFLDLNRNYYHAEVRSVDFAGNSGGVRQEINSWVAQQTQDKIRDLLQPPIPSPETCLVLCNAIYFKGAWLSQFNPKLTREAPFFTRPGDSVSVPMMTRKLKLRTHTVGELSLCALPYTGNDLAMVILLPKAVDSLAAIEHQLNADSLREWLKALDAASEVEMPLFLPKFKLDCRLDGLGRTLAAMGMPTAFESGADFSGMTGSRELFISDVVHKAFVEVNEEGTEAAAATAVAMMRSAALRPTPAFRVDHPFLFLIRENQTGSILFLGRVTDPSK